MKVKFTKDTEFRCDRTREVLNSFKADHVYEMSEAGARFYIDLGAATAVEDAVAVEVAKSDPPAEATSEERVEPTRPMPKRTR